MDEVVLYQNLECNVIWNYGNGYYEVYFIDTVILVSESEIIKRTNQN